VSRPRIGIVGAGIVGLAVARRLQAARGADVTVFDKETEVATHQTGRNSNVVHSGVYYKPGSLKARLSRRGVGLLKEYCLANGLPYEEPGKVIVAVDEAELPRLEQLAARAVENGIPDTRLISAAELRDREPSIVGLKALLIPSTGIVQYKAIAEALAAEIVAHGGEMVLGQEVVSIKADAGSTRVFTSHGERTFDYVIACAGLGSGKLARKAGASSDPQIVPFRGEYWELVPERSSLVNGLVYPVPDPRYPFLGVHFTPGIDGHVHVGPNAVPALALEGYRWRDVSVPDLWRSWTYPGTVRLAAKNLRMGIREITGSLSKSVFLRRAQAYLPDLVGSDLVRAGSGVRAQALGRDGALVDDFAIDRTPGLTVVRNAPSPAATASLAIAERIVEELPAI